MGKIILVDISHLVWQHFVCSCMQFAVNIIRQITLIGLSCAKQRIDIMSFGRRRTIFESSDLRSTLLKYFLVIVFVVGCTRLSWSIQPTWYGLQLQFSVNILKQILLWCHCGPKC